MIIPPSKETVYMMGSEPPRQEDLYSYNVSLEKRVRADHPLRKIKRAVDFSFIYNEVKDTYGTRGNVSVPPTVILKLMLLLVMYNVRSERELMETLPERLDWLWFLGYNIDTPVPDHSVLSKARKRWGEGTFKGFFECIVIQCSEKGLIDGTKVFMDASFIDADASRNSVVETKALRAQLNERYQELKERLTEKEGAYSEVNNRFISTTDPDASIVRQGGTSGLRYKTHRVVDVKNEIITAVGVTPGAVNEAHLMTALADIHASGTGIKPETIVADSKYGTIENLLACHDSSMKAHMPALRTQGKGSGSRSGIYPDDLFIYDKETDTLTCPAGKKLVKRTFHQKRNTVEYAASKKACRACEFRDECTRNTTGGRSVQRHARKEELDVMLMNTESPSAKRDIKTRQHLMERSFARSVRYGFDRARWRGLWNVTIQEYLVCAVQNIMVLIGATKKRLEGAVSRPSAQEGSTAALNARASCMLFLVYTFREIKLPMPV